MLLSFPPILVVCLLLLPLGSATAANLHSDPNWNTAGQRAAVENLGGAFVARPDASPIKACYDLLLSNRMRHYVSRALKHHTTFDIIGHQVADIELNEPGVRITSINGRRWGGSICPGGIIFVDSITGVSK